MEFDGLLFDTEQPADAGAENGANAFGIAFVDFRPESSSAMNEAPTP